MGAPDPTIRMKCGLSEIVYIDSVRPVAIDPTGLVLQLVGCSVYVDIPYKCTMEDLVRAIIPAKLRHIGVSRFSLHGSLTKVDGSAARASDVWGCSLSVLWWTKLRVRVPHCMGGHTVGAITRLQRAVRRRLRELEYELV